MGSFWQEGKSKPGLSGETDTASTSIVEPPELGKLAHRLWCPETLPRKPVEMKMSRFHVGRVWLGPEDLVILIGMVLGSSEINGSRSKKTSNDARALNF